MKFRRSIGHITSGLQQKTLSLSIINFVKQQLPAWRDDPSRSIENSEDKLNLQLCKYLDSCARTDFPMVRFNHEEYQASRRRTDLSASPAKAINIGARQYTIYDPILVIECKRLPAPTKDREKEYVTGGKTSMSGGIQRFKLGLHGAEMNLVLMIGYIQESSARVWQEKINSWISQLSKDAVADICSWDAGEILMSVNEDKARGLSSYQSTHNRYGASSSITLHHLWILMNVCLNN